MEMADVLLYLVRLADRLDVDLADAAPQDGDQRDALSGRQGPRPQRQARPAVTDDRPCFAYGSNLCADTLGAWLRERRLDASDVRTVGRMAPRSRAVVRLPLESPRGRRARRAPAARQHRARRAARAVVARMGRARREGGRRAGAYARRDTEAILPDGTVVPAVVYVVTDARRDVHHAPTDAYLRSVEAGYAAWGHDPAPLRSAAAGGPGASWVDAVFVYGTLLRGESNAHVMHDRPVRRVLDATVRGALLETGEPYPVMVLDGASIVHGELVELDDVEVRLGPFERSRRSRATAARGGCTTGRWSR